MVVKNQRQNHRQFARVEARRGPAGVPPTLAEQFSKFAQVTAQVTGHPTSFLIAVSLIAAWVISGPIFRYSDTWQLVINTGTTIVTFLMVFLIQHTQNRDTLAVQLKLSELVLAAKGAEDRFAAIEDLSDEELEQLHEDCRLRAKMTMDHLRRRRSRHGQTGELRPRAAAHRAQSPRRSSRHAHRH